MGSIAILCVVRSRGPFWLAAEAAPIATVMAALSNFFQTSESVSQSVSEIESKIS
jgi:hypothetical protein